MINAKKKEKNTFWLASQNYLRSPSRPVKTKDTYIWKAEDATKALLVAAAKPIT